jgi:hypothetical protein
MNGVEDFRGLATTAATVTGLTMWGLGWLAECGAVVAASHWRSRRGHHLAIAAALRDDRTVGTEQESTAGVPVASGQATEQTGHSGAPATCPSVTIIKAVKGVDATLTENVRSFFSIDYPGEFYIYFCVKVPDYRSISSRCNFPHTPP